MNYARWSNAKYDEAMKQAIQAPTDEARNRYYQQAETIFADAMPAIPLYHYTRSVLKNTKVGGYSTVNASEPRYTRDLYMMK
ncbi:oligopeptide ABC transporter [Photobacterium aphoticum]|nr:oligopeptide ABC transporter [Photobacterium aphoticum]